MLDFFKNSIDTFNNTDLIIRICCYFSLFLLLIVFFLIFYLMNLRNKLRIKERIKLTFQKKYEADLIEYLYVREGKNINIEQQKIINYLTRSSENRLKRKIIIQTFLKLRNEVFGETADIIKNLYYQTGLFKSAISKLKSNQWDSVARAIKELSQFEIKEAHDEIILLINHPKKEVRNEIQKYLVKLFRFDGLKFLDILEEPLSEWDQIQLLEILNKFDNPNIPDLNNWLTSTNDSIVSFTLKIAKLYNQLETKEEIINLFKHQNLEIRIQAISMVSHLGIYEAVGLLKENLFNKSLDEQIAFFKMMEEMCTSEDMDFIKNYVDHENFYIRISAMKILNLIAVNEDNIFKVTINSEKIVDKNLTIAN